MKPDAEGRYLFRAWDVRKQVMLPAVVPYSGGNHIGFSAIDLPKGVDESRYEPGEGDWLYLMDLFILMPCAQRKDVAGQWIYESDVILQDDTLAVVKWDIQHLSFYTTPALESLSRFGGPRSQIVGNQYEGITRSLPESVTKGATVTIVDGDVHYGD